METYLPNAKMYKTLGARWNATIRKWKRIIKILKAGKVPENIDNDSCALCAEYIVHGCAVCPIGKDGHGWCSCTPYSDFSNSHTEYEEANWYQFSDEPELRRDMLKHAKKELAYLEKLRKKTGNNGG